MYLELASFILILVVLITIILVIIITFIFYQNIKNYFNETIENFTSLIPILKHYEYDIIDYSNYDKIQYNMAKSEINFDTTNNTKSTTKRILNKELAIFTMNCNMSAYNLYSGYSVGLNDTNIKIMKSVGTTGYIFRTVNNDKVVHIFIFRGTRNGDDVFTNLDYAQIEMNEYKGVMVHRGFYNSWNAHKKDIKSYIKEINTDDIIIVTGHSLGCSLSCFTAMMLSSSFKNLSLYMHAPPRVGNHNFIEKLDELVPQNYAIINTPDIVPTLPPITFPTMGNTWFYSNFNHIYIANVQMGSYGENHRLDTYICAMDPTRKHCKEPTFIGKALLLNLEIF